MRESETDDSNAGIKRHYKRKKWETAACRDFAFSFWVGRFNITELAGADDEKLKTQRALLSRTCVAAIFGPEKQCIRWNCKWEIRCSPSSRGWVLSLSLFLLCVGHGRCHFYPPLLFSPRGAALFPLPRLLSVGFGNGEKRMPYEGCLLCGRSACLCAVIISAQHSTTLRLT